MQPSIFLRDCSPARLDATGRLARPQLGNTTPKSRGQHRRTDLIKEYAEHAIRKKTKEETGGGRQFAGASQYQPRRRTQH